MKIQLKKNHGYLYLIILDNPTVGTYDLVWMAPNRRWVAPGGIYIEGLKLDSNGRIVIE